MWLLTHDPDGPSGDVFKAGQVALTDQNVSRRHVTVEIAQVPEGDATDLQTRSSVTLEDQNTKLGTTINGKKIKGERFDLLRDDNEIKLGPNTTLRITWHPVIFNFNFSVSEMQQGDPVAYVRSQLEPLDIKFVYHGRHVPGTTHVVAKKKNTPWVLGALINSQLAVNRDFNDAIVDAAKRETGENGVESSALERDFVASWPDEAKFLPAGLEGEIDEKAFAPDERRREIFDGYTFIFYDERKHSELLSAITSGKGKVLLRKVVPGQTEVDEFIRYVKSIAGEKGLGQFEDGSDGRGVVVVRHLPTGENAAWYLRFFNDFALRLDHRPIEPRDLLMAVLNVDPANLRKPLEVEPTPRESATQQHERSENIAIDNAGMDIDQAPQNPVAEESPSPPPVRKPRKGRSQAKSKFKSFNVDTDSDDNKGEAPPAYSEQQSAAAASQGMFMTQQSDMVASQAPGTTTVLSQRKRPAPDSELMDSLAPTAARFKRQRLERGESALPAIERTPTPEPAPAPVKKGRAAAAKKPVRKGKKAVDADGDELLDQIVQTGHEEEADRRAEDDLLRRQLYEGDIDFGPIRESTLVQTLTIRRKPPQVAAEQGEARWDPHWNGLKNFKKFRSQTDKDAPRARVQPKKILSLEPVRSKEYGISDDYWLQDADKKKRKGRGGTQSHRVSQNRGISQRAKPSQLQQEVMASDIEAEEAHNDGDASLPEITDAPPPYAAYATPEPAVQASQAARSRVGKAAERATKAATRAQKRVAVEPLAAQKPSKRPRASKEVSEGEESDEGGAIGFRFGKRK